MSLLKQVLFVLACFLLTACENKKAKFTNKEISWLVYEIDDTISYLDNSGNKHFLVIDYRTDLSQLKSYYPIEAEVEIQDPLTNDHFRIYSLKDETAFKKYLRIAEVYRPFDLMQPVDSSTIGGRVYYDVYIFTEDSSTIESNVWKVYFNREFGILRYEKKNNIVCDLINSGKGN